MFKVSDKKASRVVSTVGLSSSGFCLLSGRSAFWRYFLQFCLVATVASAGCGCVNLASPVNNVTVIKVQFSDSEMSGSSLERIAEGLAQKAGDITAPIK